MKKFVSVFMCLVMAFLFSACDLFLSSTAKKAFEEGKLSLAAGNYEEALGYFELAEREGKKGDEVTNLIDSLESYLAALDEYLTGDFDSAMHTIDSITLSEASQSMQKDIDSLKKSIQSGIDTRITIDEQISEAKQLFANGDYSATYEKIKEIDGSINMSQSQKDALDLLRQQLTTAETKTATAVEEASRNTKTVTKVVYVDEYDKENAKAAVTNFVYAYEAFVNNGDRSSAAYSSYMSAYSPSWSNAYKTQWNYYNKHSITSYYVEDLSIDSVTFDGNVFYVVDNETISETKDGNFVRSTSRWKYTVINDGGTFKVTNYTSAK